MRRKSTLLVFWVLGILFPMAWFTRFSATYNRIFQYVFTPTWTHVVMHTLLYAVLAYLLGQVLDPRLQLHCGRWRVGMVVILVLGVALLQEGVQLWYTAQAPGGDELFDIGVDLVGGGVGMVVLWWQARCR